MATKHFIIHDYTVKYDHLQALVNDRDFKAIATLENEGNCMLNAFGPDSTPSEIMDIVMGWDGYLEVSESDAMAILEHLK